MLSGPWAIWTDFLRDSQTLGGVEAKVEEERGLVIVTEGSENLWERTGTVQGDIMGFRKNLLYGAYVLFHKKLIMFVHTLSSRSSDRSHGNSQRLVHKGL